MNDKPGWEAQYQIDALRAELAQARARCVELEAALDVNGCDDMVQGVPCRLRTHAVLCWACKALASNGPEALAALRLAEEALQQGIVDEANDSPFALWVEQVARPALKALREAFGEGE